MCFFCTDIVFGAPVEPDVLISIFNELLHSYYSSIKKMDKEQYLTSAYDLYKLLIDPMEFVLEGKKKLIIIPDGDLHYLPFEALLTLTTNSCLPSPRSTKCGVFHEAFIPPARQTSSHRH